MGLNGAFASAGHPAPHNVPRPGQASDLAALGSGTALAPVGDNTMSNTAVSHAAHIPSGPVSETRAVEAAPESGEVRVTPRLEDDWPTLATLSRRYIDRALGHTGGNKTRAADLLGIDRRTLNRILARERAKKSAG